MPRLTSSFSNDIDTLTPVCLFAELYGIVTLLFNAVQLYICWCLDAVWSTTNDDILKYRNVRYMLEVVRQSIVYGGIIIVVAFTR